MTDKQIIIDGVDVSGCEFLRNCIIPDNYGCKIDDSLCCDVGNCYYKQLKRKEQECKELKDLANHNGRVCNERLDKIDELEHDINELDEQLNAYKMEADEGKEINAELKAELEQEKALKETYLACYKAKHGDIEGKLFKLSKTLTEIKEIIQNQGHIDILEEQILQKINACEVNND